MQLLNDAKLAGDANQKASVEVALPTPVREIPLESYRRSRKLGAGFTCCDAVFLDERRAQESFQQICRNMFHIVTSASEAGSVRRPDSASNQRRRCQLLCRAQVGFLRSLREIIVKKDPSLLQVRDAAPRSFFCCQLCFFPDQLQRDSRG